MEVEWLFLGRILCRNSRKLLCMKKICEQFRVWAWTANKKVILKYSTLTSGRVLIACFLVFIKHDTFIVQPEWVSHLEHEEELGARKVKPIPSATALQSCLLFPSLYSSSSASSWDDNSGCSIQEHCSFLAWPMCFSWLCLFCWVQRTALLGLLSLAISLHICSYLISQLLLSGMFKEALFSPASLSFLFLKKFHELTSLNPPNYFPFLWLWPPSVPWGNILQN